MTVRVLARRSDQLGGRLGAIVNAFSIAERFGLKAGFVWPRGRDLAINEPSDLFEPGFLRAFELAPEAAQGRPVIADAELLSLSEQDAQARLAQDPRAVVDADALYVIARASWEQDEAARARFVRCWSGLGWNPRVRELLAACAQAAEGRPLAGVHVRAGDIVDGDWR